MWFVPHENIIVRHENMENIIVRHENMFSGLFP